MILGIVLVKMQLWQAYDQYINTRKFHSIMQMWQSMDQYANMTKYGLKYEHARKHDGILLIKRKNADGPLLFKRWAKTCIKKWYGFISKV